MAVGKGIGDVAAQVSLGGTEEVIRLLKQMEREYKDHAKRSAGSMDQVTGALGKAKSAVLGLAAAVGVGFSVAKIVQFGRSSVAAFQESENALSKYGAALRGHGQFSQAAVSELQVYSKEVQRTTVIEDDAVVAIGAQIEALSGLSGKAIPKAVQATIQLSRVTGLDLSTAATLVSKALTGSTVGLSKYGIKLGDVKNSQEVLNALLVKTAAGMEIARAEIETSSGKIQQLSNQWGDLKEDIGGVIVEGITATGVFDDLTRAIDQNRESILRFVSSATDLAGSLARQIGPAVQAIDDFLTRARLANALQAQAAREFQQRDRGPEAAALHLRGVKTRVGALFGLGSKEELERFRASETLAKGLISTIADIKSKIGDKGLLGFILGGDKATGGGVAVGGDFERAVKKVKVEIEKIVTSVDKIARGNRLITSEVEAQATEIADIHRGSAELLGIDQLRGSTLTEYRAILKALNEEQEVAGRSQADLLRETANRAGELAQTFESGVAQGLGRALSVGLEFAANLKDNVKTSDALAGALTGVGQILAEAGGLAGAFGSALSGAAAGFASGGVVGGIIGGVGGLIGGLFGGGDDEKQIKRARDQARYGRELSQALSEIMDGIEAGAEGAIARANALREAAEFAASGDAFVGGQPIKGLTDEFVEMLRAAGLSDEAIRGVRETFRDSLRTFGDFEAAVDFLSEAAERGEDALAAAAKEADALARIEAEALQMIRDSASAFLSDIQQTVNFLDLEGPQAALAVAETFAGRLGVEFTGSFEVLEDTVLSFIQAIAEGNLDLLTTTGLTIEELSEMASAIDRLGDEARTEAERQKREADDARRSVVTSRVRDTFRRATPTFSPETQTVTTVLAEPLLAEIAGNSRTMLALHNQTLPQIRDSLVNTYQPGDVNRFLGREAQRDARRQF